MSISQLVVGPRAAGGLGGFPRFVAVVGVLGVRLRSIICGAKGVGFGRGVRVGVLQVVPPKPLPTGRLLVHLAVVVVVGFHDGPCWSSM